MEQRKARAAVIVAVLALAVALYLPTTRYGFTGWDDTAYVTANPQVSSAPGLSRIWTPGRTDVDYPLTFTSFWLEHRVWGAHPSGYHATNVLLHGVNAALVAVLLLELGVSLPAAGLAAALFAVHPLQVMTVAWIAERKNLLALLFTLLALSAWIRADRSGRSGLLRGLALVAFCAALMSKTVVLGLPLGLFLYDRLVVRRSLRPSLAWASPMIVAAIAAAAVTISFERGFVDAGASGLMPPLPARLQIAGAAPWFYLGKLALPAGLSPAYPRWSVGAHRLVWWLPLGATLAAGAACVVVMTRSASRSTRLALWLTALAAILLGPSLGVVALGNLAVSFVSDHFLYLPSAFLLGALAIALDAALHEKRSLSRTVSIAALAACAACAAITWSYEPVFRDAESLWSRVLRVAPDSYAAHLGLAESLSEQGRFEQARPHYERALAIEPSAADAYLLLGRRTADRGDDQEAAALFERARSIQPGSAPAMTGLAAAREKLGAPEQALALYEAAVRADPHDLRARMGLGEMQLGFARPAEALIAFRGAIDLAPGYPRGSLGAATSLRSLARYTEAVDVLRAGLAQSPGDVPLLNLLALTLATAPDAGVRRGGEAVTLATRALAAGRSATYELRATLAAAYAEAGRFDEALAASRLAESGAVLAGDDRSAAEQRRRSELYARGEPLRIGR